jgi:hypothetical protein
MAAGARAGWGWGWGGNFLFVITYLVILVLDDVTELGAFASETVDLLSHFLELLSIRDKVVERAL